MRQHWTPRQARADVNKPAQQRNICVFASLGHTANMVGWVERLAVVIACVACSTCGPTIPSSSLVGDWTGRVAPLHFVTLEMRFTQQGSSRTGVACYMDPEGSTDGKGIAFSNAPVSIDLPNVSVTMQNWPLSFWFGGQLQSDGSAITGESAPQPQHDGYPMSL